MSATNINTNNKVTLSGIIVSEFEFSHEVFGEGFYVTKLEVMRKSGMSDYLKLLVSERLTDVTKVRIGETVIVNGAFRSFTEPNTGHLVLQVFVNEISDYVIDKAFDNNIVIDGYLCKPPVFRTTPNGRNIADLLVAVNRAYGKTDYLPCIAWGRNAEYISQFEVGTHINAEGRIQSRVYTKKLNENEFEERIAYEVSIATLKILEK